MHRRSLPSISLNSPAKLNLYLEVINKRKDGYHNISTLFERINLCDRLILIMRTDKEIKVSCKNPLVPTNETNLCYRSAELLQKNFKVDKGIDIRIIKKIPVGAGLAGGSSNAATTLLGLNKIWRLNLSTKCLLNLASKVGSDVPFFIYRVPFATGLGRGEKIRPLRLSRQVLFWHVLVVPRIQVSTPLIYNKWDEFSMLTRSKRYGILDKNHTFVSLTKPRYSVRILTSVLEKKNFSSLPELLFNGLEDVTLRLYPEVQRIKEKLSGLGLKSILMSGSGPAVFGIVSSRKEAVSLTAKLHRHNSTWQVFVARSF